MARVLDRIAAVVPGANHRPGTKGIGTGAPERVPVDDRESQMVPHRSPGDNLVRVVPPERQRIIALGAFVLNHIDAGKRAHRRQTLGEVKRDLHINATLGLIVYRHANGDSFPGSGIPDPASGMMKFEILISRFSLLLKNGRLGLAVERFGVYCLRSNWLLAI